ncbi:MAG: sodium:solute symporter family protein [Anaerohalosphaeraceae bacterium]|nr:sodium:solute symporter family protein [Anaerohalosphaeraceae bacterium]
MFGLSIIDIIVIGLYFAVMISIGIWSMRKIKNQEDYFLAGRSFGKFIQTFANFGQGTSADTCVGVTTTTYSNGAAGIWSSLLYLFATPMYWMVAPWSRRLRLLTLGDFFIERYGSKRMAGVYAVIGSVGMMTMIAVGFSAMTKTVVALAPKQVSELSASELSEYNSAIELDELQSDNYQTLTPEQKSRLAELSQSRPQKIFSHINQNALMWLVSIIVMLYAVLGGLEAAFLTDTIQGIFIIILSLLLIPFGWLKINAVYGGSGFMDAMQTVHSQLPESFFEIFGSPNTIDFTWYYILALSIMGMINVVIQPNSIVVSGSAKSEYECRFGSVVGCFMKRFVTIFWGFFALMAIVLYHDKVHNPDFVWGYATLDLLGPLNLGLVGLMIACLMAALMSTADCLMITCSSLLTHNLYMPSIPGRSEKHYVFVGRIIGGLVVIGGALIATQFDSILQILKFMWEINVMVAASFWLGMKWRRATRKAAWASIVTTAVLFFVLPLIVPVLVPSLRTNDALLETTHPAPVVRTYTAHQMDVDVRMVEIEKWDRLNTAGMAETIRPVVLRVGDEFTRTYKLPVKSIFWTKGVKANGQKQRQGYGMLSLELLLIDKLGGNLSANPYALNETIRIATRTTVPFIVLVIVSFLTKRDDKKMLDRFFVKMKTRVSRDHDTDAREMQLSYANPDRFNDRKLFPNSDWEFDKWTREDAVGFTLSVVTVFVVIGFLMLLIGVGKI